MSDPRTKRRRPPSRAYRPALDGKLEDRVLLSKQTLHQYLGTNLGLLGLLNPQNTKAGAAFHENVPPFALNAPRWNRHFRKIHAAAVQTIRGGQAANVVSVDGSHFRIQLGYISNTVATSTGDGAAGTYTASTPQTALLSPPYQPTELPQPIGTLRVYAMPNGEVGIIVDGSTPNTELTINPLPTPIRKGYAHSYAYGQSGVTHILNIGQITVNSGSIGSIEGFHTANLVGPLVVNGTATVDRIAFNAIMAPPAPNSSNLPGPSITVGGTLNTLDVLHGITLGAGDKIQIGNTDLKQGDLNLLNVGGDITLNGGSQIVIGRDLGLVLQPPKGTGTGSNVLSLNQPVVGTTSNITEPSVSTYIQGNLTINDSSQFIVGRQIDNQMYIGGNLQGVGSLVILPTTNYIPTTTPVPNFSVFSQATSDFVIRVVGTPFPPVAAARAPTITSAAARSFAIGSANTFTVTTTGTPTAALNETGTLPSGVTFVDNGDGTATLAGTPAAGTAAGSPYTLTITANNGVTPNFTQTFTLTVAAAQAPVITSLNNRTFTVGTAGSFPVTTTGTPTAALSETGTLPSGVAFVDNGDGTATLAGTPAAGTAAGSPYTLMITANNGVTPNFTQTFKLTVS